MLRRLGLLDDTLDLLQTTRAMYPAMVHVLLPFFVLPVYAACLRLEPEQLRAGQSLGAGPRSLLRHVVLPHLRPSIVAATSLVFMLALAFYITPLLIGGPTQLTIATLIDREFSQRSISAARRRWACAAGRSCWRSTGRGPLREPRPGRGGRAPDGRRRRAPARASLGLGGTGIALNALAALLALFLLVPILIIFPISLTRTSS